MRRIKRTLTDLRANGPLLKVVVEPISAIQELLQQRDETIPSVRVTALIDTGASGSAVQADVFEQLGLKPIGNYFLNTPSTLQPVEIFKYRVRIVISESVGFDIDVAGVPMGGQQVQCLIGRDILEQCVLSYNGPKSSFTLNVHNEDE